MLKFFSFGKTQAGVLITLLVLIFLGATYFYIYIPQNEKTVQERRFRCLQNINTNIDTKIGNSISMLNYLLTSFPKNPADSFAHYTPNSNFKLMPLKEGKIKKKWRPGAEDSLVKIKADLNSKQFIFSLSKLTKVARSANLGDTLELSMSYGFEQFIKPLLTADVFDNYIVFINNNDKDRDDKAAGKTRKLVYETFPSGLSYKTKDSILALKSGVTSPGIHSMNIGGEDYRAFTQPIVIGTDNELIIIGLVSNKNYQAEKTQLPLWFILLLLTVTISTVVALPWIKLYHMGSKDKLTITDGISSILVAMLLMSLLFFIIFKYSLYFNSKYRESSSSGNKLANRITTHFEKDLDVAYIQLTTFDAIYPKKNIDIINLGKGNMPLDSLVKKASNYITLDQVYWLNSSGLEITNWSADSICVPHSNLGTRKYFKNTKKNEPNKTGTHEFYLEQVVSRTSGKFTSIIAKKSNAPGIAVAALSFTAKSLDSLVMPDGYQFAIIDNTGEVLYHSHPERDLNENLKNEFADSSDLVSCIEAKADKSFKAEYYGKRYDVKVKAFPDLPYFTVVFEDQDYNDTRDTEAYAFTIAMLICLVAFLVFQFIVIFLVSSKRSFFRKQFFFETAWIAPKMSFHHHYNLATICNLIIMVLLPLFFKFSTFLEYLFILVFCITFIALFLNCIFAVSYKKHNLYNYKFKIIAIRWLLLFIVVVDYIAFEVLENNNFRYLLLFEAILTILSVICYKKGPLLLAKARSLKKKYAITWTYTHSFALMTTTRLIITSGIPVAFFFIYSFNYEQNLDTRYRQLNFARAINQKIPQKSVSKDTVYNIKNELLNTEGIYCDSLFINTIEPATKKDSLKYDTEDYRAVRVLNIFRILKNNIAVKSNDMNFHDIDGEAFFSKMAHSHSNDPYTVLTDYKYKFGPGNYSRIRLTSANINYPELSGLFRLFLLLSIIIFYFIVHHLIKKLFALNIPSTDIWENMDKQLLLDNELNNLLLIVGPPGSGKLQNLLQLICEERLYRNTGKPYCIGGKIIQNEEKELLVYHREYPEHPANNVFIVDMMKISAEKGEYDKDWKDHKQQALGKHALVIINHFEYNIRDVRANKIKLDLLELLMEENAGKIIIISTVHPLTFLDSFSEQEKNDIPESELERWHVILGHFRIVIQPLQTSIVPDDADVLERMIMQETQHTHYLHKMKQIALSAIPPRYSVKEIGPKSDSIIFKLQITSHYFYTYIWQSLTKEEKFILYDLAEEGLVNPYDDYNLSMLIRKGLIIKPDGTLMLFNMGFRNYILTSIGNMEVNRIKAQVKDNGNWSNLKGPLNLAILAILIFLVTSQQESYTRIITYVTTLGAGIPAVLKIFSLVGSSNNTQKAE